MEKLVRLEGLIKEKGFLYFVKEIEGEMYVCRSESVWHRNQKKVE